jgi:uncharacterized repeat protein (TIGR03809 family)
MTLHTDVAHGRDLLACWRELAEHRLDYLTRMFESGRWRRYYSELAFLENIREAKIAVETWRGLSESHAVPKATPIAASWSAPPRLSGLPKLPPRPVPIAVAPRVEIAVAAESIVVAPRVELPVAAEPVVVAPRIEFPVAATPPVGIPATAESELAAPEEKPRAAPPVDLQALERALVNAFQPVPDIAAIEQRYPLLRLTL